MGSGRRGFKLMELLTVISIVAVLLASVVFFIMDYVATAMRAAPQITWG